MPTLYVENIPSAVYGALRARARARRRTIAAEILALLEENFPTAKELHARRSLLHKLGRLRMKRFRSRRLVPSTEELQRQDRMR